MSSRSSAPTIAPRRIAARRLPALVLFALLGLCFAVGEPSAAAAGTTAALSAPQLSISLDNGRTTAAPGDTLRYTLTIRNVGSADVRGLLVTQTVPSGLTLRSADAEGTLTSGRVRWKADLKSASAVTFHTTMAVRRTPDDVLRLATVACAAVSAKAAPLVCASHSDLLPAGAKAAAKSGTAATTTVPITGQTATGSSTAAGRAAQSASAPTAKRSRTTGWLIGGGAAVVVIGAVGLLLLRRGRQRQG